MAKPNYFFLFYFCCFYDLLGVFLVVLIKHLIT